MLADMGEPLDPDRYDWDAATAQPLTDEETFQLVYTAQVEWGTEGTFASLNISRDPIIRRFLHIWLEQEMVHAEMLARLLERRGTPVEALHRRRRHRRGATRGKYLNVLARRLIGADFFAVHMTWGAVNELTTLRFYGVIRARTENQLLQQILRDVMAQEAVHYSFYRNVAIGRLVDNPRGQRIVRWTLEHLWSPVGVGLRTSDDADRLVHGIFEDRRELATQMDAQLNRIPGLADLNLVGSSVDAAVARRTA